MNKYYEAALIMMDALDGNYYEATQTGIDACLKMKKVEEFIFNLEEARDIVKTGNKDAAKIIDNIIVMAKSMIYNDNNNTEISSSNKREEKSNEK